jgi:arylsulfatase A-like enzyme
MSRISRRSFLKMAGAAAPTLFFSNLVSWADRNLNQENTLQPNIIVLLFDAMSARNLSVYGYPRLTSPNLERFAERATVYHSHYSSGNYTIPGVASLLTGTYPWTHRAINHSGVINHSRAANNIFRAIGKDYHRLVFPQSIWANFIVTQFQDDIDRLLSSGTFGQLDFLLSDYFPKDQNLAVRALDDFIFKIDSEPASPIFGLLQNMLYFRNSSRLATQGYPRGLPHNVNYPLYFRLEDLFDGLASLIPGLPKPFFTYLHLFPPHAPYRASDRFDSKFIDKYHPIQKPVHKLSEGDSNAKLTSARRSYDEYIASLDFEFGRLLDSLEDSGVFDNSYVVITSDHGEMFERGEKAHSTPLLYEPVVHVPLLISAPGQKSRRDVYAPTNAVDLLPTLLNLAGKPIPSWSEGKPLPGLGGVEDFERSTYVVEAKLNSAFGPLTKASFVLRKGNHKLTYYMGYQAEDSFELYDLDADIEEMNDLYPSQPAFGKKMKDELLETIFTVNAPFVKK